MSVNCWELKLQIQRDIAQISDFEKTINTYTTLRDTYSYVCYTDYEVKNFHTIEEAQAQWDLWNNWQPTLHPVETTAEYYNPLIAEYERGIEKLRLQIADEQATYRINCEGEPPVIPPDIPPDSGFVTSGCFILTAIGNQPLIDQARLWRDNLPLYYRPLITLYYILGPLPAKSLYYSKKIRHKIKPVIERIVGLIVS